MAANETESLVPSDMDIIRHINHQKATLLIPAIIYTVVLMVVGIVGNPLCIYIYGCRWQKTTTRNFLLCLAVVDLSNCLITMPMEIFVMLNFYFFENGNLCKMSRFTTYVMNNTTAFVFCIIAADRYIRICKPHTQPISPRGALIGCGVATMVGVGVSWPALILYGREEVPIPLPTGRVVRGVLCMVESEFENTPYPLAFFIYLWVGVAGTAIFMIVMYILIGRVILKRNQRKYERSHNAKVAMNKRCNASTSTENDVFLPHTPTPDRVELSRSATPTPDRVELSRSATPSGEGPASPQSPLTLSPTTSSVSPRSPDVIKGSNQQGSRGKGFTFPRGKSLSIPSIKWSGSKFRGGRSTLMLFAITVVYILSFVPFLIITTIRTHVGNSFYPSLSRPEQVAVNIFLRSYLINNCANPIVYGLCNSQFRAELKKLFKCSCFSRGGGGILSRGGSNRPGGSSLQEPKSP